MANSQLDTIAPAFARTLKQFRRTFTNQNNQHHFHHSCQGSSPNCHAKPSNPSPWPLAPPSGHSRNFSLPITEIMTPSASNSLVVSGNVESKNAMIAYFTVQGMFMIDEFPTSRRASYQLISLPSRKNFPVQS